MDRISTFSQHTRAMTFVTQTQTRLADLQNQVSSGRKSMDYTGVSRDSARLVSVESTRLRLAQYTEDNALVERRLTTMENNVTKIFELMSEYKTLLVDGLNAENGADLDLANRSQQILNQVAALLNVEEDGRRLFAGSRTDTAPVDTSLLPNSYTVPTSDPTTTPAYYVGDSTTFSVRVADNFDVSYGVLASDQGFERAIRALDVVIKAPLVTDRTTLNHSLGVTSNAIDDLADIRTKIGVSRKTLVEVNAQHRDAILFAEENINDIENVDIAETVTRMNGAQVTLEASFLTLSRLQQLSLLNFIR